MRKKLFTLLTILFNLSCTSEKNEVINLSELKQYSITQRQTEITLLKSFVLNKDCNVQQTKERFADVFLAKVKNTNDTILVFSVCRKTFPFLKSDYKGARWLVIDSLKIAKDFPQEVNTSVDKSIDIKKYKIIVSEINNLED